MMAGQQLPALCPSASRHPSTEAQHLRTPCRPLHGDTTATTCRTGLPRYITTCRLCLRYPHARSSNFPPAITLTWLSPRTHPGSSTHRCCWRWRRPWTITCWPPARPSSASSWTHRTAIGPSKVPSVFFGCHCHHQAPMCSPWSRNPMCGR